MERDGVTGDEDEAEEVVSDRVVEGGVEVRHGLFECGEVACQVFVFTLGDGVAAEEVDGAAFGGGREPCPGVFGDSGSRHCSRAARRASCARSSARPTSRADSMRQKASMVRCRSAAKTATDHTSFGCVSASGAISLLPDLPVERGLFFPAEYLLRRRRMQSLPARRPGGSRPRIRLRGSWGCA